MTDSKTNKFMNIAEKHKKATKRKKFSGTFADYLNLIEEDRSIVDLAHKRLYKTILGEGVTKLSPEDPRCANLFNSETLKTYDYFQSKFFGMERPLAKVMRYLSFCGPSRVKRVDKFYYFSGP